MTRYAKLWARCIAMCSALCIALGVWMVTACADGPSARSSQSFDEIARRVDNLSATEIGRLLGAPDSRQPIYVRDERWIWWNYTFLDGEDIPPEDRGQTVHLVITFRKPESSANASPTSEWRVARPYGIAFRRPGDDHAETPSRAVPQRPQPSGTAGSGGGAP